MKRQSPLGAKLDSAGEYEMALPLVNAGKVNARNYPLVKDTQVIYQYARNEVAQKGSPFSELGWCLAPALLEDPRIGRTDQ